MTCIGSALNLLFLWGRLQVGGTSRLFEDVGLRFIIVNEVAPRSLNRVNTAFCKNGIHSKRNHKFQCFYVSGTLTHGACAGPIYAVVIHLCLFQRPKEI